MKWYPGYVEKQKFLGGHWWPTGQDSGALRGPGSNPGLKTKILQAVWHSQGKKKLLSVKDTY